ncbi:MAG: cupredoxin family copper-binding protein [Patescibacteria group bacterium]|nr:cupredoxin family copper-binding protein [Patescibacteria group bacterium]
MKKFLSFSLLLSAVVLMANSCSSPAAKNQPAAPAVNPGPPSFSVSQEPVPAPTPAPAAAPTSTKPNAVATSAPATGQANPAATAVPPPPTPSPAIPPATPQIPVNIQNFSFNPAEATIAVGDTVVWTNSDSVPHQIASASFNSAPLSQGDTFSQKFTAAGTYAYHCAIHPSMTGKIIVK